jgi:hypothetical protein
VDTPTIVLLAFCAGVSVGMVCFYLGFWAGVRAVDRAMRDAP